MKKLYLFILLLWLMPLISIASNLTGKVTVLSTGAPVEGAIVILQHNFTVHIDTTDADGNYAFIYFEGMKFEVKVIKDHYNIIKDSIDIPNDMTIIHDFQLTAPTMDIVPASINDTLHSGVPYQRWITVTNNGDGPLEWHTWAQTQYKKTEASSKGDFNIFQKIHSASFPLKDNPLLGSTGYAFSFGSNPLFFSFNTDDPSNMNIICADTMGMECCSFDATDNGIMYFICPLGYDNSDLMKMDVNTGEITDIGSTNPNIAPLYFWTGLTCDRNTGIYYACATNWDESYLFTIDITTGASTLIGSTGLHYLQGIAIDGTGQMYGIDAASDKAYLIDKTTGTATALGPLGFDSYYRHDIAWNPEQDIIYVVANYDDNTPGAPPFSELRIMDRTNGNTYVVGHFADKVDGLCFTGEGYPSWLVVGPPVEGIIPADSSVNIPVTFDWNYIPPQKDITFQGNICFISNPDVGTATIPVTYTIVPPPPHYYLAGTITHAGQPVAGVTVTATNGSYSLSGTTGADGTFWLSLTLSGTYAITAEIEGYNTYHGSCVIQNEYTPFDINITAPTMAINPLSIEVEWPQFGQTITQTLTITNNGDGPLLWNGETETGFKKLSPKGSTGYAFSLGPEKYFFSFDTDNPSITNIISTETISPAGGTFDDRHTGFMFIIDANDSHLKKVNAATGNVTDIGLCSSTVGEQQLWTGIQVDKLQGGMYGVTTDNNESYLYGIDQSTGGTAVIGPTGIPNCADFAIDGGGQMYGIDIVGDNAYTIDMSTGASTLLGPLGFNAGNVMGMSWNSETDNIYFTSYNNTTSKSELYILDRVSGNATMVAPLLDNEVDGLAFSGNLYTWLTIDPKFGTVPPGDSVVVTASIDGSWFPPHKDYDDGTITFTSDPNVGTVIVPVTILPPPPHYYLAGTVTHSGQPVAGVTVTATKDSYSQSATTGADGTYWLSLAVSGTYVITTEAIGYNSYYGTCEIYDEYTPYDIYLTAPTMNISPDSLAISLNPNESGTLSLTLSNNGDGMLEYNVHVVSDSLWNYYVVPMSGYLGFGESTNLNFPVYANVPPGTYHAMIIFTSSPDVGTDSIPVTFTVLAGNYPTLTIPIIHNAEAGSIFIPVHAKYFANLGSFQFSIEYDPALLTYMGTSDWYPGIDAITVGNPSPGHLTFVWAAETEGINIPDDNFFTLGFTWNGQAGQTSALAWSDDPTIREFGDFDGNIFVPSYINGQIYGYIPGPKIGFETVTNVEAGPVSVPVHTYNMSNLGAFQFTIDYDTTLLTFNGTSDWYPGLENVTVGNPSPGHITFDWTAENGGVTIENGNFFTLGLTWKGTNQSSTLYWGNEPTAIEFSHYNGNTFIPDYFDGGVFGYAANSTVSIEDAIVEFGSDSVVVPVHAQFATNPDYFQFSIEYDPEMTFFQGVTNWNPTIVDPVTVEEPVPGHITFQWCASTQGINIADGHFFDLVFNWPILTDNWWLSVPITWSDDPMFRYFSWDYGSTIIPANYINGSASGWVIGDIPETSKEAVKIYPNPASDYLNVEVGNDICKINVINNLGITVYEQNITGGKTITINTSGYRAGNYIVQLITKDGQTINRKMMKQ